MYSTTINQLPIHDDIIMDKIDRLIETALDEDIGSGDITSDNLVNSDIEGKGVIVAKEPLVITGLDIAEKVFKQLDSQSVSSRNFKDGDSVQSGDVVFEVKGKLHALLVGERTALNFLQRLSGIATNVRSYVNKIGNRPVRLVDTRKTIPGWRVLEKYAVRVGGAFNHRMGLYDGVLIKDNHLAISGGIQNAMKRIRENVSHLVKIEVEVSNLSQVKEALESGADIIMLDNMDLSQIREAVEYINGEAVIEVSGGILRTDLKHLADTGIDIISIGALTHHARSVDLSMRINNSD